ncbi:MAG: hypothetical protein JNL54_15910 [Kineosporiaceae bacterium]|nr:hypothetical protein [Kineosporiaceae bacterium]
MSGAVEEAELVVRGGAGGTTARLEDLESAAEVLIEAGQALTGAAVRLGDLALDPVLLAGYLRSPLTGLAAEAALAGCLAGPHGLAAGALRLGGLGTALRAAVGIYRAADAAAQHALNVLSAGAGTGAVLGAAALPGLATLGAGLVAFGSDDSARWMPRPMARRVLAYLAAHPGAGDRVGAALPGAARGLAHLVGALSAPLGLILVAASPPDQRRLTRVLSVVGEALPWLNESRVVRVGPITRSSAAPPSGVEDLIARTAALYEVPAGSAGVVRVERVTAADGSRSWIAMIPGTQAWPPRAGVQPFDLTADVNAIAGRTTAASSLVTIGLQQAGARPGEPVLLVGHSLGGIVAAQMAADPVVRQRLSITHVVTAGSPIGSMPVPREVQVLALEHTADVVPWTEGRRNPDRLNWVTVQGRAGPDPVAAHEAARYVRTGAAVDTTPEPSAVRAREQLSGFLARPGSTATAWVVPGDRVLDAAHPHLTPVPPG